MSAYWRMTRAMMRRYRRTVVIAIMMALFTAGGLSTGLVALGPIFKIMLDQENGRSLHVLATEFNESADNFVDIPSWIVDQLPNDPFQGVLVMVGALVLLAMAGGTTNFLHQFLSQKMAAKMVASLRHDAFDRVLNARLSNVTQHGPSEYVARIVRDAAELQRGLIALVSKSVTQVTQGFAGLAAAVVVEWRLTLIATIGAPVLAFALRKIGKRVRRGSRGTLQAQEDLLRIATERVQGLRSVKANTGEVDSLKSFDEVNDHVVVHELKLRSARAASAPIVEFIAMLAFGTFTVVASKFILDGTLELERFMLALACLGVAGGSFRPLAGIVTAIQTSAAPAQRLEEVLTIPVEEDGLDAVDVGPCTSSIVFSDVVVQYPVSDVPAVNGVSVEIQAGEHVAIVGPNGCGKTTLVSLIPRLLETKSGAVLVDGRDIANLKRRSLRRQIGVVTQETILFQGSIAENIAFGADDPSREEIVEAAQKAHAHKFIDQMPDGYDTNLVEHGASLSGGQRQRLAIARAILRDPSIMILDEATSQIDAESEHHINEALQEFCRDRTLIVVAHRLSTVIRADRILVMEDGRCVDQGTHDELLQRCALYQRLTQTQLMPNAT